MVFGGTNLRANLLFYLSFFIEFAISYAFVRTRALMCVFVCIGRKIKFEPNDARRKALRRCKENLDERTS